MKNATVLSMVFSVMMASSVIADPLSNIVLKSSENSSFDGYMHQLKQLRQADSQGKNIFKSNRSVEFKKFVCVFVQSPASSCEKTRNILSTLKRPDTYSQQSLVLHENKQICRQLYDEQIIPVWAETNWVDGCSLIFNGFNPPEKIKNKLIELNYWEQSFGIHSVPERKNEPFSGRDVGKINGIRLTIINAGFFIKFDTTFNIWRITSTNSPVANIP